VIKPLQQRRFRRISASALRGGKKVQSSRIGSRLHVRAFQRAIDELRTLPFTPQKGAQKANLSFKNRFPYIFVIVKPASSNFACSWGLPMSIIKSN